MGLVITILNPLGEGTGGHQMNICMWGLVISYWLFPTGVGNKACLIIIKVTVVKTALQLHFHFIKTLDRIDKKRFVGFFLR